MSPVVESPDYNPGNADIAKVAFEEAIKAGRLNENEKDPLFAGNYMYMGRKAGRDYFKSIDTRDYLP